MTERRPTSAWLGSELDADERWIHHFTAAEIDELERCYGALEAQGKLDLESLTRADFALPRLGILLKQFGDEIESGRGFAFMRGLPVERWGLAKSRVIYWGISAYIGVPVRQNAARERLVAVTDVGIPVDSPTFRGPRGKGNLHFHSDFADAVGLMCIRNSKSGGVSRICSSTAIVLRMQQERPELIPVFERGFRFFRKGEEAVDETPISRDRLPMLDMRPEGPRFLFWPGFAKPAAQMSGVPLTPLEAEALDYVNDMAHTPGRFLDTHFQPGDLQYLNNYKVLHSRTDFEDWPEPERKRYLERIWLCTDPARRYPKGFADLYGKNSLQEGFPLLAASVIAERARGAGIAA